MGDAAAAVAAIHMFQRSHKQQAMTLEELRDTPPVIRSHFATFRKHLASVSHELFTKNLPHLHPIQQGPIGDCYIISTCARSRTIGRR